MCVCLYVCVCVCVCVWLYDCLNIPGIKTKAHQLVVAQKAQTLEHLSIDYPSEHWIHVYSDGLSQGAVRNGVAGVYIQCSDGTTKSLPYPRVSCQQTTDLSNKQPPKQSHLIKQAISNTNIVFLIDWKSVIQSVQNESQDNATRNFKHQFSIVSRTNNAALRWIPAHCGITGNESADKLAKQPSECQQHHHRVSLPEMKTPVKGKFNTAWKTRTGSTYPNDPIIHLNRREQTMIFRLRTGHCRLGSHL